MFLSGSDEGYLDALPGIRRKTLSFGDATLMRANSRATIETWRQRPQEYMSA